MKNIMQNKNQLDENGYPHGIWENYWSNGQLCYKGNFVHGKRDGYWEWYRYNGNLKYKKYYAK